jgi:hypothetical protein
MANFLENRPPSFAPYVQQLPVEAMVSVGSTLQGRYNEGLQRIQSQIDNVAGLPIGRDVDKQYLQSKLNALGTNLKGVAAGDFSNFQLVNSVGGMVNRVGKDPFIQAAVYSTANDKKQSDEIENDRQKGTLTPHSEYNYQLKRESYYNNPNLKDERGKPITFSGKYNPSWDVDGNILKAVTAVGDSKWTADNVFKLDPSTGRPLRDVISVKNPKTGKIEQIDRGPIYSDFAIKEMRAGKFNENITAAINSVLDRPEAKQEMAMRGIYNYRGYDDMNEFISMYKAETDKGISLLKEKETELKAKMITETDKNVIDNYQTLLSQLSSSITTLEKESDPRILQATEYGNNIDAYKIALYTQQQKNNWIKGYTTEQYSKEYIKNIPYEVKKEAIKAERDWWAQQQNVAQEWSTIKLNQTKWDNDPNNPNSPKATTGEAPLEKGNVPLSLYTGFINEGAQLTDTFKAAQKKFVFDWYSTIEYANGSTKNKTDMLKEFNTIVDKDADYISRQYEKAKQDVTINKNNSTYSQLSTALPRLGKLEKDIEIHGNRVEDMNKDQRVINAGGDQLDFSKIEKDLPSYSMTYNDGSGHLGFGGNNITKIVTPKDIINANIIMSTYKTIKSESEKVHFNNAVRDIENKFGVNYKEALSAMGFESIIGNPITKTMGVAGVAMGIPINIENVISLSEKLGVDMPPAISSTSFSINRKKLRSMGVDDANIQKLQEVHGLITSKRFGNVLKAKEEVLKEKMKGNSPLFYELYPKDAKSDQKESVNTRLTSVLNTYKDASMDVSEFDNLLTGKKGYSININVDRGTPSSPGQTLSLDLYDGEKLIKSQPITKKQAEYIKGVNLDIPNYVSSLQQAIQWNRGVTSNSGTDYPNAPGAYNTAYYQSHEFNGLNRDDIMGADVFINDDGLSNDYIYIKQNDGSIKGTPIMRNGTIANFQNIDVAGAVIEGMTSSIVDEIINNAKPKDVK